MNLTEEQVWLIKELLVAGRDLSIEVDEFVNDTEKAIWDMDNAHEVFDQIERKVRGIFK